MTHDQAFRFIHPVPVRFKDVDVGGHAHHSHALVYFEEARAAYWGRVSGSYDLDGVDYILAEASTRFHARVLWPQTLAVGVRVSKLGKRHFHMEYEARSEAGELLLSGATVQVMYDYEAGAAVPMSEEVREAISEVDGPYGPGGRPATPESDET